MEKLWAKFCSQLQLFKSKVPLLNVFQCYSNINLERNLVLYLSPCLIFKANSQNLPTVLYFITFIISVFQDHKIISQSL